MNPLLTYMSIAKTIANALLTHSADKARVVEWTGYLEFATALAAHWTAANEALGVLDTQLRLALLEGRGLTLEERGIWRSRETAASEVAKQWLLDHPKAGE